jgi:hypothetical protein
MHAMGWSTDKNLKYMLANSAMGEHDAQTEVPHYVTWPGQATVYKVGECFLRKLRISAETKLGAEFDPRDFYHVVLQCGPVPLNVLEKLVDNYIAGASNSSHPKGSAESVVVQNADASSFVAEMTFANWCKCCVVPGTCPTYMLIKRHQCD